MDKDFTRYHVTTFKPGEPEPIKAQACLPGCIIALVEEVGHGGCHVYHLPLLPTWAATKPATAQAIKADFRAWCDRVCTGQDGGAAYKLKFRLSAFTVYNDALEYLGTCNIPAMAMQMKLPFSAENIAQTLIEQAYDDGILIWDDNMAGYIRAYLENRGIGD